MHLLIGALMFGKRYFVAISLFARLEKARLASIWKHPNNLSTFTLYVQEGNALFPLGYVHVANNGSRPKWWNERMRERDFALAVWRYNAPHVFWDRRWPDLSTCDEVQLTSVYPVRAMTEMGAARAAWARFLEGDRSYTEWYDASDDKRWSKLFHR
jgi:hypothetical protein